MTAAFDWVTRAGTFAASSVLLLISLYLLRSAWRAFRATFASRDWRRTEGVLDAVDVKPAGSMAGADGISGGTLYSLSVRYSFRVEDRSLVGCHVDFAPPRLYRSADQARQAVPAAAGQPVTVWFDPADPQRSVLRRASGAGWAMGGGSVMALASIWLLARLFFVLPALVLLEEQS